MKTELRQYNEKPTIFVDDKPQPSIFCSVQEKYMQNFIDAGFQIFDTHPLIPNGWVGPGKYDYTLTDEAIEKYLCQKKDALLILRFWMGYPDSARRAFNEAFGGSTFGTWWTEQNPEHVATSYDGNCSPPFPSFASDKWRAEAGEALKRVIEHTEGKYGDRIFAYVPGAGSCGEWFQYNTFADDANYNPADYSPIMTFEFRQYLKKIYSSSIDALNKNWNTDYLSFQNILLPAPEARFGPSLGILRNPAAERHVLDFYEYFNSNVSDTLVEWAALAKAACKREKLIMAFYGYHWVNAERHSLVRSGHVHLDRVLKSPDIDIIVAPYMYDFREVGGVISSQTVAASIQRSGKMCLYEIEPATSIKADWPYGNHLPETHGESIEIMKRDMACTLVRGAACWYMDLLGGMYDHPELVKGLDFVRSAGEKYSAAAGVSCAQVAVILHDRASLYFREADPFLSPLVNMFKVWELERTGTPYDDILLSDLRDKDISQYRLFIIPNAVYLSKTERSVIKEKCFRDGNIVLWCYSAGVLDDEGFSVEGMQDMTGMRFGYSMEPGELTVELVSDNNQYTAGLSSGISYGTGGSYLPAADIKEQTCLKCYPDSEKGFKVSPRFWVEDEGAEVLGVLKENSVHRTVPCTENVKAVPGKPGLAVKNMGDWISVFSAAPMVPKEIVRSLAVKAGCHVYTDHPGQTFAAKNYFGLYSHKTGKCTIKLPYRSKVTEVFTNKLIAESADQINMDIGANTTILLHYTEV